MMALSNNFDGSLVSGKALKCCELTKMALAVLLGAALRVCSRMDMQCCTQANEDMLGMSLSRALQDNAKNFTLGSEIYSLRQNAMTLYNQTSCKLLLVMAKTIMGVLIMLRMVFWSVIFIAWNLNWQCYVHRVINSGSVKPYKYPCFC